MLRSTAPPNGAAQPRSFQPCAELVTLPLTLRVAPGFSRAKLLGTRQEPDPRSPAPRQSRQLVRIRAPSIDECSLARARHRSHGFAAARRLPKPVRPSCAARFPALCLEARPFAFPRGPSSVRRLLQPKRSASTRCESTDPRSPTARLPVLWRSRWVPSSGAPGPKTRSSPPRSQPSSHGPGVHDGFRLVDSSRLDCS